MENPILFIDMSYYIFYRFYALRNWYKRSQEDELDVETLMENELFINKYHKLFKENIKKIQKKHNIQNSLVIFGKDCRRYDIWRNQYYDEYKKIEMIKIEHSIQIYLFILMIKLCQN